MTQVCGTWNPSQSAATTGTCSPSTTWQKDERVPTGRRPFPSEPSRQPAAVLERAWYAQEWQNRCGFTSARRGTPAVDVFCRNMAFSVQWRPESSELAATDYVAPWQPDRFNNHVPAFGHTRNLVVSPDGRYAYLSTEEKGLLVFERVGVGADEYALLKMLSVSPGKVSFGPTSTDGGGCIGLGALSSVIPTTPS